MLFCAFSRGKFHWESVDGHLEEEEEEKEAAMESGLVVLLEPVLVLRIL